MPKIALTPYSLKNATLKIAADSYEAAISSVAFTPSASKSTFKAVDGGTFTDLDPAEWVCDITYAQDFRTAGSLSNYLHTNEGTAVVAEFVPTTGGTGAKKITATVVITPGAIGGAVGGTATATVQLGVQGKPVIAAAA